MIHKHTAPHKGAHRWLLAIAMAGTCSYAQTEGIAPESDVPEAELAPVTVSAHDNLAVPYDQTGVSVTVLDIDQLKTQGITSLPEALTTVPGVYALPGGGDTQRGNICNISVRGLSKSSYTLPMVDGMRIFAVGNGNPGANMLARTNLFDLGTAEVLRGAEGATYGNGSMGSVIYLQTPEGKGEPGVSTFQEGGSHDSYTGNVTVQGATKHLSFFVSSTYEHTNNDLKYADGTATTKPHAGQYRNWSEALRLDTHINESNTVTLTYRREDSGYRDASNPAADPSRYKFRTNLVTGSWNSKLTDKWTSNLMAGYYGYDAYFGENAIGDIRNVQTEWRNSYSWNKMNTSSVGFCWVRSDYTGSDEYSKDSSKTDTYSVFAEHRFHTPYAWDASLAARMDTDDVIDERFTIRGACSYNFKSTGTRLFGSIGTGYNAPSQFQRSKLTYESPSGGEWTGNPDLRCESSVSADFGVEQQVMENHYISATYFWTQTKDAIVADYDSYPFSYRNSRSHQTSQGVELAMRGTWERTWNTGYRVAYTLARPVSDGAQVPNSARQVWSADVHTSPVEHLTTGLGLSAACQRTGYDGARQDNYYTLRWYAQYEVNKNLTLHMRVENLTNQKFVVQPGYDDPTWGYPSLLGSGISIYAGCTLRF